MIIVKICKDSEICLINKIHIILLNWLGNNHIILDLQKKIGLLLLN